MFRILIISAIDNPESDISQKQFKARYLVRNGNSLAERHTAAVFGLQFKTEEDELGAPPGQGSGHKGHTGKTCGGQHE